MRFCMVTTFFPPYHFGGDAVCVERLSNALGRRGHHVDVLHDRDAYDLVRSTVTSGKSEVTRHKSQVTGHNPANHPNVHVHAMQSRLGRLSPILTQQTARPWGKPAVRRMLESGGYDVVHFHNTSLIGSTALRYGRAVKLYTMHEHWLICPMHVLWKFDREPCDRPQCLQCCLRGGRPPQLWRYTGRLARDLRHIDRFISPSRFTAERHRQAGLDLPTTVLPYFAPEPPSSLDPRPQHPRPYFLFVGRLVALKGVDTLIRMFRRYRDADVLIAGEGEEGARLRAQAADLPHVHFLGARNHEQLAALYRDAIALIMPSVGYEVFGIVLVEAFAAKTPVIVRDRGGMPEPVAESGGGFVFRDDEELCTAIRTLQSSPDLRRELGEKGYRAYRSRWSEQAHLDAYLAIVEEEIGRRSASTDGSDDGR